MSIVLHAKHVDGTRAETAVLYDRSEKLAYVWLISIWENLLFFFRKS